MMMWWNYGRGLARATAVLCLVGSVGSFGCAKEENPNANQPFFPPAPVGDGDQTLTPTPPTPPTPTGPVTPPTPMGDGDMTGMEGDSGTPVMADKCENLNPMAVDVSALTQPLCDREMCINAHCLPMAAIPDPEQTKRLGTCSDGNLCVPDKLIASGGNFILPTCDSVAGSEGRCISSCVPQVADQADRLEQGTCDEGELCAPCTDPLSGEDTGVCGLSCDPGPADPPLIFQDCCDDGSGSNPLGKCVPADLAGDQVDILPTEDCSTDGFVCAPNIKIEDQSAKFPSCMTKGQDCNSVPEGATQASCFLAPLVGGLDDKPGACVPTCILELMTTGDASDPVKPAELYTQSGCDMGSICAPCTNPSDNTSTGACD